MISKHESLCKLANYLLFDTATKFDYYNQKYKGKFYLSPGFVRNIFYCFVNDAILVRTFLFSFSL